MKITIELPDWAEERNISIMAGMELLAYKRPSEDVLYVKRIRCDFCGWCCVEKFARKMETDKDGKCLQLVKVGQNYECSHGVQRPWMCSWYDPVLGGESDAKDRCCIRYRTIEVK